MAKVAVLGAGSWGTALAQVLAVNGNDVLLWGRDKEQMAEVAAKHENKKYLPNISLTILLILFPPS